MACDPHREEDGEAEVAPLDCAVGHGRGEGGTEFKSGAMGEGRPWSLGIRGEGMQGA